MSNNNEAQNHNNNRPVVYSNPSFEDNNDNGLRIARNIVYFQNDDDKNSADNSYLTVNENANNDTYTYVSNTENRIGTNNRAARNENHHDEETISNDEDFERESWSDKADFIFNSIGYIMGLGNFWMFPYYIVKYGGAFFIAYALIFFLFGMPSVLLEMYIGQFTSRGAVQCWGQSALLRGIGLGMVIKTFIELQPYTMITIRTFKYIVLSFNPKAHFINETLQKAGNSSFQVYFENDGFGIGQVTENFGNFGLPKYELVIAGFVMWAILFFILLVGLKYSGKIIYVTVGVPVFFLFLLLVHGLSLKGAPRGINKYFNNIDFSKPEIWLDATVQMMFSMGIASAGMNTLASYRQFKAELIGTAILICCVDFCTSILCSCVVLSYLGNIETYSNRTINRDSLSGYVLLFSIIPQAMLDSDSTIIALWLLLLFVAMLTLGFDTTVTMYRVVICGTFEVFGYPSREKMKYVYLGFSVLGFIFCIPMCCPGGYYWEMLITKGLIWCYIITWLLLFIFVICFYGPLNICYDIEFMIKDSIFKKVWWLLKWYFMACWYFCIPVIFISLFVVKIVTYKSYNVVGKTVPAWMHFFEIFVYVCVFLSIILYVTYYYIKSKGVSVKDKLKTMIVIDAKKPLWGPALERLTTDLERYKNGKSKGCCLDTSNWDIQT